MNSVWTEINTHVNEYMFNLIQSYKMKCETIGELSTLLYNNDCCLLISIDRFNINFQYACLENGKVRLYDCGDYLSMRFDDDDRKNLIDVVKAGDNVINDLIITANGLLSKCEDVLTGQKKWLEKYKTSSRYSEVKLSKELNELLLSKLGRH